MRDHETNGRNGWNFSNIPSGRQGVLGYAGVQNSDDGRVLRVAAGVEVAVRRPLIHLVCLPAEADLINAEGFKVRLPVRGRAEPVLLESRKLPGKVTAGGAAGVNPKRLRPRRPLHAGAAISLARRA